MPGVLHPHEPRHADGTAGRTTLKDWLTDDADERAHRRIEVRGCWPGAQPAAPRDRRILQLRFVQDRTQQEIADELGITQMQVRAC